MSGKYPGSRLFVVAAAVVALIFPLAVGAAAEAEDHKRNAQASMKRGHWEKAAMYWENYLGAEPGDVDAIFARAECEELMDNYAEAVKYYGRALASHESLKEKLGGRNDRRPWVTRKGEILYRRGLVYFKQGQMDLAKQDIHAACWSYEPACTTHHTLVDRLGSWIKNAIAAVTGTDRPDADVEQPLEQGEAALKAKDLERAWQLANDAVRRDSENPLAYYLRARVAQAKGDHETALADLSATILRSPTHKEALHNRGLLLLDESRYLTGKEREDIQQAGISDFQGACRLAYHPSCTKLRTIAQQYERVGVSDLQFDYPDSAIEVLSIAIAVDPVYPDPYFNRALAWKKLAKPEPDKAIEDFKSYIFYTEHFYGQSPSGTRVDPEGPLAYLGVGYFQLGMTYREQGMIDLALNAFTRAINADEKYSPKEIINPLHQRGKIYYKRRQYKEALADMDRACSTGDKQSCEIKKIIRYELEKQEREQSK